MTVNINAFVNVNAVAYGTASVLINDAIGVLCAIGEGGSIVADLERAYTYCLEREQTARTIIDVTPTVQAEPAPAPAPEPGTWDLYEGTNLAERFDSRDEALASLASMASDCLPGETYTLRAPDGTVESIANPAPAQEAAPVVFDPYTLHPQDHEEYLSEVTAVMEGREPAGFQPALEAEFRADAASRLEGCTTEQQKYAAIRKAKKEWTVVKAKAVAAIKDELAATEIETMAVASMKAELAATKVEAPAPERWELCEAGVVVDRYESREAALADLASMASDCLPTDLFTLCGPGGTVEPVANPAKPVVVAPAPVVAAAGKEPVQAMAAQTVKTAQPKRAKVKEAPRPQCVAYTVAGTQCKCKAAKGSTVCSKHDTKVQNAAAQTVKTEQPEHDATALPESRKEVVALKKAGVAKLAAELRLDISGMTFPQACSAVWGAIKVKATAPTLWKRHMEATETTTDPVVPGCFDANGKQLTVSQVKAALAGMSK